MNDTLVAYAVQTENASIAIVESDHVARWRHFHEVRQQLCGLIESVRVLSMSIKLVNGTYLYFFDAPRCERLRGMQLDRIETVPAALRMMPDRFLETRLKPGVSPDEGIAISEVRHG